MLTKLTFVFRVVVLLEAIPIAEHTLCKWQKNVLHYLLHIEFLPHDARKN